MLGCIDGGYREAPPRECVGDCQHGGATATEPVSEDDQWGTLAERRQGTGASRYIRIRGARTRDQDVDRLVRRGSCRLERARRRVEEIEGRDGRLDHLGNVAAGDDASIDA